MPSETREWQSLLKRVHREIAAEIGTGKVADYIPALAAVDPQGFAMAVATMDGEVHGIGMVDHAFSIQSISKVFSLTLALEASGAQLWDRVGREPSGSAFNSIVQLEQERGVPRNPFINAGALVVTDGVLSSCEGDDAAAAILDFVRLASDSDRPRIDDEVAASERQWGDRNRSLAYFMKSFGRIDNPVDAVTGAYFRQCAIEMSTRDLARAGLFLANNGLDPVTGECLARPGRVRRIAAVMMTCGHYDMSGDFAFRVGLPGKSGVGGGILCIAPGQASIAVWSPALNAAGNSHAGTAALECLAREAGLSVF